MNQFILLPSVGLRDDSGPAVSLFRDGRRVGNLNAPQRISVAGAGDREIRVLDSVGENGPMLVELDETGQEFASSQQSPFRAVPLAVYQRPNPRPTTTTANTISEIATFSILAQDGDTQAPIPGVEIRAFDDYESGTGANGTTDEHGCVSLSISGATIDRLYGFAPPGYWSHFSRNLDITTDQPIKIKLNPVDLSYADSVRHYYSTTSFRGGTRVKVGIVDTGVGPHTELNIVGGQNTVTGQPAGDWHDIDGHGTHVAGIIGANGQRPGGLRGMAPGVELYALRVFDAGSGGATNYSVLKALIYAVDQQCDIVNLSLGGGPRDLAVEEAIADACSHGMLVVVAAGNDGRRAVGNPAAYPGATAVSAMGRERTFPKGSIHEAEILRPPHSNDDEEFLAAFSNIGNEIAFTAPGVGVLSTLPNEQFGPMSGTSMAAPVIAGAAACLLSRNPSVLGMPRNQARSRAIKQLLQSSSVPRGFGKVHEGYGMPDPSGI